MRRSSRPSKDKGSVREASSAKRPAFPFAPRASRFAPCGFTLIEVVVVILVIGMTIVAGLSGLVRPVRLALSETASEILTLVESARSSAVLNGSPRKLVYDLDARPQAVWIEVPPPADDPTRDPERVLETRLPARLRIRAIETGKDAAREEGIVRLSAEPSGFLSPHLVRLATEDGAFVRTAAVRAFPGASRAVEGEPAWEDLMRERFEEDLEGVKALEPQE